MKKINLILRKCRSLSRQLGRSSSYSSLRSKSSRDHQYLHRRDQGDGQVPDHQRHPAESDDSHEIIFVGRTRKRYVISSKYLSHPLINALIEKPSNGNNNRQGKAGNREDILLVKCEVVLFDHLLWMLDNSEDLGSESLEELAALYAF